MKKVISLIIVCLMFSAILISCKNENNSNTTSGTNSSDTTTTVSTSGEGTDDPNRYDEDGYILDSLPDDLDYKIGGVAKDVNIYSWSDSKHWEWSDDAASSNAITYALYTRQQVVQERLGINIILVLTPGAWDKRNEFISTLENNAGLGEFDIVGSYTPAAGIGANKQLFANLMSDEITTYFDFSKPWWPESVSSTSKIGENIYFMTGDITSTFIRNTQCTFVNLDMFENLGLSDSKLDGKTIYDVVNDGDWTLEMQKTLAIDVVGTTADGIMGLTLADNVSADSYFYSGGFLLSENNNGVLALSSDLDKSRLSNWFDEIQKLYTNTYPDVKIDNGLFKAGKSLFHVRLVTDAQTYASQENTFNFALIPMPKHDADQENYRTIASYWVTLYSIPADAPDKSMSGAVLEALASDAYRSLTGAIYYETFLYRYLDTDSNSKMFKLISENVVFDTARTFADTIGIFPAFRNGVNSPEGSWSTIYAKDYEVWGDRLALLYSTLG